MLEIMQLVSINAGVSEAISFKSKTFNTGIRKYPVDGPVVLTEAGVRDDIIVDSEHHGGVDQAIYAYGTEDYEWWVRNAEQEFNAGLFGENLTIRGLPRDMNVGDRLLMGEVVLEATSPRIPCRTFAARMQDSGFGMAFRKAERPGVYFRVLNGGEVAAGDSVTFIVDDSSSVSILELFRFNYALQHDIADMRRYLDAPIANRFREKVESRLAAAERRSG